MYCKNCGVHVDGIYDVCPLCKSPLEGEPAERPLYPEKHIRKIGHPVTFSSVYLIVALLINVICIAVNLTVARKYLWCVFALILTLYGYFTLKTTVFYKGPNGAKVFSQTLMLSVIFITAQYIFKTKEWCFAYAMPVTVISSLALHLVFVGAFRKRKGKSFFRYMWMTCLLGIVPAAAVMAGACTEIILPMVACGISMITLILLVAFTGRTIYNEIKKKTHI